MGNSDGQWRTYIKVRPHLLANSFGSHMVLQHQSPCLWGFGAAGAAVTLSLNGSVAAAASSSVAANGSWFACLPAQPASHAPATISVAVGGNRTQLEDVVSAATTGSDCRTLTVDRCCEQLFGEVWVASGQSNMAFSVSQAFNASAECAASASFPSLRLFTVAQNFEWGKYHTGEPRDFNEDALRRSLPQRPHPAKEVRKSS